MTCTRRNCTCTGDIPVPGQPVDDAPVWAIAVMVLIWAVTMFAIWNLETF